MSTTSHIHPHRSAALLAAAVLLLALPAAWTPAHADKALSDRRTEKADRIQRRHERRSERNARANAAKQGRIESRQATREENARTVYDIGMQIREETAFPMANAAGALGVTLAAIFAAVSLLSSSYKFMAGRKQEMHEMIYPFIILALCGFSGTIIGGVDTLFNRITRDTVKIFRSDEKEIQGQLNAVLANEATLNYLGTLLEAESRALDARVDEIKYGPTGLGRFINKLGGRYASGSHWEEYEKAFAAEGVPEKYIVMSMTESGGNDGAVSSAGARGRWQIMPQTLNEYHLDASGNPARGAPDGTNNISADMLGDDVFSAKLAAKVMAGKHSYLTDRYGSGSQFSTNWDYTLAAYNCGEGEVGKAIDRASAAGGVGSIGDVLTYLPEETQNHLPRFMRDLADVLGTGVTPELERAAQVSTVGSGDAVPASDPMRYVERCVNSSMNISSSHRLKGLGFWTGLLVWLHDRVFICIQTVAEMLLTVLAVFAPFVFALSILPRFRDGLFTYIARFIQTEFWKVVAAVISWAGVKVRGFILVHRSMFAAAEAAEGINGSYGSNLVNGIDTGGSNPEGLMAMLFFTELAALIALFSSGSIASWVIESAGVSGGVGDMKEKVKGAPGKLAGDVRGAARAV